MADELLVERRDDHAVLTLNRPEKRNALSVAAARRDQRRARRARRRRRDEVCRDHRRRSGVLRGLRPLRVHRGRRRRGVRPRAVGVERPLPRPRAAVPAARRSPRSTVPRSRAASTSRSCATCAIASTTARFAHPERTFGDVVYGPLHDLVGGAVARDLDDRRTRAQRAERRSRSTSSTRSSSPTSWPRRHARDRRARLRRPARRPDAHEGQSAAPRRLRRRVPHPRPVDSTPGWTNAGRRRRGR